MTEPRLRLIAFVCAGGVVRETGDLGTTTFAEIFLRNAFGDCCQFAIVLCGDEVRAYDLHTTLFDEFRRPYPGKFITYPNLDAAYAGCVLTHS
jgi:hypothetical protein